MSNMSGWEFSFECNLVGDVVVKIVNQIRN